MSEKEMRGKILQKPRGTRDFVGEEYKRRKLFFQRAENTAEHYGFQGIETPIIEHSQIYLKGVGEDSDIVSKEMYRFSTRGGDDLTLRPEGTAGIMRAYIEHGMVSLPQPLMFYYGGPFFRHEKPQKGRYRQLYQFGLEIIGSDRPQHDALIISLGYEIIKKYLPKTKVIIHTIGKREEREKFEEKLRNYYRKHGDELAEEDRKKIETNPLRILDSKEERTKKVNQNAPRLSEEIGEESQNFFTTVLEFMRKLNIPYRIEDTLVRGLDYYEHTVFEYVIEEENGSVSYALGGGGRYDTLSKLIGYHSEIPSVGLGIGVDRILDMEERETRDSGKEKYFVISLSEEDHAEALALASETVNYPLELYLNLSEQKIGKQFKKAEKLGYNQFIIIENGKFKLKRKSGEKILAKEELLLKIIEQK